MSTRRDRRLESDEYRKVLETIGERGRVGMKRYRESGQTKWLGAAWVHARDGTAIALMGEAGLRVGEVCALVWSDVLLEGVVVETLRVRKEIAKGSREREIPLSPMCQCVVTRAFDVRQALEKARGPACRLVSAMPVVCVTPRQVERRVVFWTKLLLGRRLHPHVLRHFCANRWRRACGDPYRVQRLLGHARIETTGRYTKVNGDELRGVVDKASEL